MTNTSLIILSFIAGAIVVIGLYIKAAKESRDYNKADELTFDRLFDMTKAHIADTAKDDVAYGVTDEEWEALVKRKATFKKALSDCVYGIDYAKEIVKASIRDFIETLLPTEDDCCKIIDFRASYIDYNIKFEIIMHFLKKEHGKDALPFMIDKYRLDDPKYIVEDGKRPTYVITEDDLDVVYKKENFCIEYDDMLDIITILIWQKYKGFGVIDTVREMNINGVNGGTSGSVLYNLLGGEQKIKYQGPRSIWIQYRGKYIHLRFLTFGTEEELKRITIALGRYKNLTQLTAKKGYKISTMYDQSRVLTVRPNMSEYWAFFVRKPGMSNNSLEYLINSANISYDEETGEEINTGRIKNTELPEMLLKYIVMAKISCGLTGRQGSGKTSYMRSLIKYIDPRYTIRVIETTPELFLRECYPERNILSASETEYTTTEEIQDAFKKSDGQITVVGEVATNELAARMIQNGQVSSDQTLFTHHGMTADGMVYALRNSLDAATHMGSLIAEQQVVSVVRLDIHFEIDKDGTRVIERITEIVPVAETIPYPKYDPKDPNSINLLTAEYYYRRTDRRSFETRDIMHFDRKTNTYVTDNWFTDATTKAFARELPDDELEKFICFAEQNWRC